MDRYDKHENTNYSIFTAFAGDRAQWIVTGSEDNKVKSTMLGGLIAALVGVAGFIEDHWMKCFFKLSST